MLPNCCRPALKSSLVLLADMAQDGCSYVWRVAAPCRSANHVGGVIPNIRNGISAAARISGEGVLCSIWSFWLSVLRRRGRGARMPVSPLIKVTYLRICAFESFIYLLWTVCQVQCSDSGRCLRLQEIQWVSCFCRLMSVWCAYQGTAMSTF